jgi:S1-C subfamily serine protease
VLKAEQARIATISKASQATISVFDPGGQGGGSGVVITADGYALTNFHVVKPAGDHMKCSLPDGQLYDAVIVGIDPTGDVALIKLLGRDDFPQAELADSDQVRVGDWCFAVGNPFLLATDFQPTVTYGIVSGVHRYQYPAGTLLEYTDCIQTDASINPGNSGGPLFDAQGRLIGINGRGSFEKRGRVNVGVGYAISINQIKNFMGYLRSGRIVDHATLGATVSSDVEGRVVVTNIIESSDAYRRGLRYGDEVVSFGGRAISTANSFKNVLGIFPKGWRVPFSFRRDGKQYDVLVRLAGVHAADELIAKSQGSPQQPIPRPKKDQPPQPDRNPKGDDPEHPVPVPKRGEAEKVPEEIAKYIKTRSGYANYYFNALNRDRVWTAFQNGGQFQELTGLWTLSGEMANGGPIEISLGDRQVTGSFPNSQTIVDLSRDLDEQLGPTDSGGLLVALYLWQRLLTLGPDQFGDVYYLGTAPMIGHDDLVDVLVATHNVVEARFMFDAVSGRLLGMEYYPSNDSDPCEIYFGDYQEVEGRWLPRRMEVRFGDHLFGIIPLQEMTLLKAAEKAA